MALIMFTDGFGGSSGDVLVSYRPVFATGVIYVDSVTGNNSYAGTQRDRPLATLAAANSASANGTVIVLLSTHSETIASTVTISNNYVTVVGEGSSSGIPTATIATGANTGITVSGVGVQLRNFKLATSTSTNTDPRIAVTGSRFSAVGLYCQCSGTDEDAAIDLQSGSTAATIQNCTFISTATSATDLPTDGLLVRNAGNGLELDGCVFSDGTYGFSSYAFNGNGDLPNIRAENISLLLGAVMRVGSAYGYVHVGTSTGGGRVV